MNATAIIEEIKQLPPVERREVVRYVRDMEEGRHWSPEKLGEYEARMVAAEDPIEAERLKEQLIAGFYGDAPDA